MASESDQGHRALLGESRYAKLGCSRESAGSSGCGKQGSELVEEMEHGKRDSPKQSYLYGIFPPLFGILIEQAFTKKSPMVRHYKPPPGKGKFVCDNVRKRGQGPIIPWVISVYF